MSETSLEAADAQQASRWRFPFTWLGLIGLAIIVFELTSQPALAAVAVCLKFGWDYFLTALWLRRTDPNEGRGWAYFWLYLAGGLWKTALVALLMTFGFILVMVSLLNVAPNPGGQGPMQQALPSVRAVALTFLTTFGLSFLSLWLAIGLGRRHGVLLWLNGTVHRARREDFWPPAQIAWGRTNLTGAMMITYFLLGFVGLPFLFHPLAALLGVGLSRVLGTLSYLLLLGATARALNQQAAWQPAEAWAEEVRTMSP